MQSHCFLGLATFCAVFAPQLGAQPRPPEPCDRYLAAVRADSTNLEAAASLGRCSVRDYEMIAPGGDSARLMFRSSWSAALRALRRAVELDPAYGSAYRPLFRILFAETRDGCSSVTGVCGYVSPVLRDRDSVVTIPRVVHLNRPGVDTYAEVVRESGSTRRANLSEARARAERWAKVAPNDRRPHEYLGRALLGLGEYRAAADELEYAATLGTPESRRALFWDRIEALIKSDRGADARRALDLADGDPRRDTTLVWVYQVAALNALLGRDRPPTLDSARARLQWRRVEAVRRDRPPPPSRPEPGFPELLAAGDTVGARRWLARMDLLIAPREGVTRFPSVGLEHLRLAEYHLALGDTALAEARLADIERPLDDRRFRYSVSLAYGRDRPWLGSAWLLSGDLAAARGRPEAAARMYRRVVGLWGGGDPDLQPVVERARAKLGEPPAR